MHVDTHVLVWLAAGLRKKFPAAVIRLLEDEPLRCSPAASLELQFLYEIGRVTESSENLLSDLKARIGLEVASTSFELVAAAARALSWTRDPFDRLIAAHALTDGESLLTKDRKILAHLDCAVWAEKQAGSAD